MKSLENDPPIASRNFGVRSEQDLRRLQQVADVAGALITNQEDDGEIVCLGRVCILRSEEGTLLSNGDIELPEPQQTLQAVAGISRPQCGLEIARVNRIEPVLDRCPR